MKRFIILAAFALFGAATVLPAPTTTAIDLFGKCTTTNKEGCAVVKENDLN